VEVGRTPANLGAPNELVQALANAVPSLELVDVSAALRDLRAHKSSEEIAQVRHSAQILDAAFEHMDRVAAPQMRAIDLWAVGIGELCRLGSEMPRTARWASAARPRALARPAHGLLPPGLIVAVEMEAAYNGYGARAVHAMAIEKCGPVVEAIYQVLGELWERAAEEIQGDMTVGAVQRRLRARGARLARPRGQFRSATAWLTTFGSGLGRDAPDLVGRDLTSIFSGMTFQEGWAFSLGVWMQVDVDGRQYLAGWEDPVVVGESGAIRLGSRVPGRLGAAVSAP
jgi:Xaa-Pro aminopeptidase